MTLTGKATRPALLIAALALLVGGMLAVPRTASAALPDETKEQKDERMEWWREAKFGMFIHWGLYAIPAGEWEGKKVAGIGEWIMHRAKIPVEKYAPLQKQFNPVKFDAKKWVGIAKQAGMKYIVITSKHHDGFCLFDSKLTDYDIMDSPYGRDVLKPLAEECQKQGIKMCWYHSIMDWYQPDAKGKNFPKYVKYMKGQLKELLTNYGDIGVLWFDGEWIKEWDEPQGIELEKFIRGLQPKLIVNNRVGKRKKGSPGDFGTPEQHIPPTGIPGWDWETCMTMNDTWGFKKDDHNWKSTADILHKLVDIVSKGGNFLLNVGPTAEGVIPQPSVERLDQVGEWLEVNGESIYGTSASPFAKLAWGRCTQKPGKLYLHVFDWPKDGRLVVPGLKNKVTKAYLLVRPDAPALTITQADGQTVVSLPKEAPDAIDSVIVLEVEGKVTVETAAVRPSGDGALRLEARTAILHGNRIKYESGSGKDNVGFWTDVDDFVTWALKAEKPGTYDVEITYACPAPGGSAYAVELAGQTLSGKTKATGSWAAFKPEKLGTLKLAAGRADLAVKATSRKGEGVMNLRAVVLTPAK